MTRSLLAAASALAGTAIVVALATTARAQSAPAASPTPLVCANADTPPRLVRAVLPETPAQAQQQGVTGTVEVIVSLDADGGVIGVRVKSSASPILNVAALMGALRSTYVPEVRGCVPRASETLVSTTFSV